MDLDLRAMRHVLALGRHRHFGRAATALNISQPALSRSIASLEQSLGIRLFERNRSGVQPTSFGELVLAKGERLVGAAADLERDLARLRGLETGELRVGAGLYPAEISVATALGRLSNRHPGLRVSLLSEQWRAVADAIVGGRLDMAVLELSAVQLAGRLALEPLPAHRAHFVCRAGHPLLRSRAPKLAAILAYPLVGPKLPPRVGSFLARASRHALVDDIGDYVPAFHVEAVQAAKQIIGASDSIGVLPGPVVAAELVAGVLAALPFKAPWLRTNYGFAYSRDRPLSPPALAFMAEVRAVEAEAAARHA
jgi:DNA-binding transcriptional LysR family regulator